MLLRIPLSAHLSYFKDAPETDAARKRGPPSLGGAPPGRLIEEAIFLTADLAEDLLLQVRSTTGCNPRTRLCGNFARYEMGTFGRRCHYTLVICATLYSVPTKLPFAVVR